MKDSLGHELPREEECSCWDLSEGGWRGCSKAAIAAARRLRNQLQRSATTTAVTIDTQLVELSSPMWARDNEYSRRFYSEETLLWRSRKVDVSSTEANLYKKKSIVSRQER